MFGLTEFDGQSRYGEVPVYSRRLLLGQGAGQRAPAPAAHRQVRPLGGQRGRLDQRPPRRAAHLRRLPRGSGQANADRARQHRGRPARTHRPRRAPGRARLDGLRLRARSGACPGTWPSSPSSTEVRQLPRRRRQQGRQPDLHRRRQHPGHHADLHLRPAGPAGGPHGRASGRTTTTRPPTSRCWASTWSSAKTTSR